MNTYKHYDFKVRDYKNSEHIFSSTPTRVQLDHITAYHKGRLQIISNGIEFECVFLPSKNKKLYVFPSFAGDHSLFSFKSWSSYLDCCIFYIEDTTKLNAFKKGIYHPIFYYFGTDGYDYRKIILEIIMKLLIVHGIDSSNVYFCGTSCAGFISIWFASRLKKSNCIAFNPQFNIPLFMKAFYKFDFEKYFDIRYDDSDRFQVADIMCKCNSNIFIFIKRASKADFMQLQYLEMKLNKNLSDGFSILDNIYIYIYIQHDS